MLYVANSDIDTQGKCYVRALQHLFVGIYILEVFLVALFAIGVGSNKIALGPLILMIIFLVFTILYHISLNSAMDPLVEYLPKNLEAEEHALLAADRGQVLNSAEESDDIAGNSGVAEKSHPNAVSNVDSGVGDVDSAEKGLADAPATVEKPKGNFFMRWLRPDIYHDYSSLRRLVPSPDEVPPYPAEAERDAYFHPSITAKPPLLWLPSDALGVSKQEVAHTKPIIHITDDEAWLDDKNKINWNVEKGQPPIYEEKITY